MANESGAEGKGIIKAVRRNTKRTQLLSEPGVYEVPASRTLIPYPVDQEGDKPKKPKHSGGYITCVSRKEQDMSQTDRTQVQQHMMDAPKQEASRLYNRAIDLCEQKPLTTEATHRIQDLFSQAIVLDELNPHYWVCRADTFLDLQDYTRAIADYQQVLVLDPRHINAWINLGYTYEKQHQWTQALAAYDAAIEHDPEVAVAHYNRGDTLRQLDRAEEAVASYTQAIHICPDEYAGAYLNRANILSHLGRHDEALADYNHAYALDAEDSNIAWTISWLRFGPSGVQAQDVERLLATADLPDRGQPYLAFLCRAVVAFERSDMPGALAHLEQAGASDFEDQWDTPFWIGIDKAMQGETEPARQAIECALERGLPPLLLKPLYWLQSSQPFFDLYARPLLQRFGISPEEHQK